MAATTFCCAAIATTIGMYMVAQNSTPSFTPWRQVSLLLQPSAGRDEHDHRETDTSDIRLDAKQDAEQVAEIDAEERADRKERNTENGHEKHAFVRDEPLPETKLLVEFTRYYEPDEPPSLVCIGRIGAVLVLTGAFGQAQWSEGGSGDAA